MQGNGCDGCKEMTTRPLTRRLPIGDRLRSAREAAGLSQGQVAKLMGLHRPTISEIEAGRRRVSADEVTQFAEVYGVGTDWILSERDPDAVPDDDKILLAARQLSRMKDDDLARLMKLIHMLKKPKATP